jgi:hypothetical protein
MSVDSTSKNEAIVRLLEEAGPLSVHAVTERMNEAGYRITSTGQTLTRLKTLARRNPPRVEKVNGEKGSLWQALG